MRRGAGFRVWTSLPGGTNGKVDASSIVDGDSDGKGGDDAGGIWHWVSGCRVLAAGDDQEEVAVDGKHTDHNA